MIERISNLSSGLAAFAWDRYARLYDVAQPLFIRLVGAFGELSYEEFEEDFVTRACLKPGQTVLDVACGTGAGHAALGTDVYNAHRSSDVESEPVGNQSPLGGVVVLGRWTALSRSRMSRLLAAMGVSAYRSAIISSMRVAAE